MVASPPDVRLRGVGLPASLARFDSGMWVLSYSGAMSDGFVNVSAQWMQDPTAVPAPVNQILVQAGPGTHGSELPDSFVLTFGHVMPPFVTPGATPEQFADQVTDSVALIAPVGRFTFSPERLRELHNVLSQVLEAYDGGQSAS